MKLGKKMDKGVEGIIYIMCTCTSAQMEHINLYNQYAMIKKYVRVC